jgi:hypothetical protein
VETQTHYLIADTLNKIFPLPNLRKKENLNLDKDADYRTLLADYGDHYRKNLPEAETLAEQIAYEYLLLTSKSILRTLSDFNCHSAEYFRNLTN